MLRAGTETGSLINHIMADNPATPELGMGATICCWTDRHAGTIIRITRTQIHVQRDTATRTDTNGMSESQEYSYAANPAGVIDVFRMTRRGWRNAAGNGLSIGVRKAYYDFSF
jgi:ribosomal protein S14